MKRFLALKPDVVEATRELVIGLAMINVSTWVLEFALLMHEMVDTLSFSSNGGSTITLMISSDETVVRSIARRVAANRYEFQMARNQLEYLHAFLLRAYRDGVAEVDHLHLEGTMEGREFDMTIMVDSAKPPMASDEARKLLNTP